MDKVLIIIRDDLLLSKDHEDIQGVLNQEVSCTNLIVTGMKNTFEENFMKSEEFQTFWTKLGKSVNNLQLSVQPPVELENYFNRLRTLVISNTEVLQHISSNFFKQLTGLNGLYINDKLINYIDGETPVKINRHFVEILKHQKSLEWFNFLCEIPLIDSVIHEIFAGINYEVLETDQMIFDCDPLPTWSDDETHYWIMTQTRMMFVNDEFGTKVTIKPLWIQQRLKNDRNICDESCTLDHKLLKSDSVLYAYFDENQWRCLNYYKNCFEGFKLIEWIIGPRFNDPMVLQAISDNCKNLKVIRICYNGPVLSLIPPFTKLIELWIVLEVSDHRSFSHLVKSLADRSPNLLKFSIEVKNGMTDDECVEIITRHLKLLHIFHIFCGQSRVTTTGLEMIGETMQDLTTLEIFCHESPSDIQKLFDHLPKLEVIRVNHTIEEGWHSEYTRHKTSVTRSEDSTNDSITKKNETHINDLPPELLEKIFTSLDKNEQLPIRATCQRWFDICSSSSRLFRILSLQRAYLSYKTNPVKLFMNTKFKYNTIVTQGSTIFAQREDLTEFWRKIGTEIQDLCFLDSQSNFMDAFKTGLKVSHLPKLKTIYFYSVPLFYELWLKGVDKYKKLLSGIETIKINNLEEKYLHSTEVLLPKVTQILIYLSGEKDSYEFFNRFSLPKLQSLLILHVSKNQYAEMFQSELKFHQLKELFIGKQDDWNEKDFDLIVESCPKLNILGLVVHTNVYYNYGKKQFFRIVPWDLMTNVNCNKIVNKMFEKLELLSGIYFVMYENKNLKPFKSYLRTGVSSFKEDNVSHPLFEIQLF